MCRLWLLICTLPVQRQSLWTDLSTVGPLALRSATGERFVRSRKPRVRHAHLLTVSAAANAYFDMWFHTLVRVRFRGAQQYMRTPHVDGGTSRASTITHFGVGGRATADRTVI